MLSLKEARLLQYDGASPDLCLIFEDCETDLAKFVNDNPFRKDQEQRSEQKREFVEIGLQIAQAIYFLHSRYITHGNIKSEIILVRILISLLFFHSISNYYRNSIRSIVLFFDEDK